MMTIIVVVVAASSRGQVVAQPRQHVLLARQRDLQLGLPIALARGLRREPLL